MLRFDVFERLGLSVAAMSDIADGDCGRRSLDQAAAVEARQAVSQRLNLEADDLVCANQVHGIEVAVAREIDKGRGIIDVSPAFPETDGILTNTKGVPIAIFVADCVPVYLFDPVTGAGGILHAGREGTHKNICAAAIERMKSHFGTIPENVHALIGPSAGPCCYEVSPEIAADWSRQNLPVQGRRLDLWQANARQLAGTGVCAQNIEISALCTVCSGRFHSYRKGAQFARNMAILSL